MGARARTLIYVRSSLPLDEIHDDGNGPSWSMLVVVNYHVSRTPTSPSSPVPVVVQFAIADLHCETSGFTPTNLAALPPFFSLPSWSWCFVVVAASRRFSPRPSRRYPRRCVNCTIFLPWKVSTARKERENARGTQYPTIKTPFLLFQLRIEFNGGDTITPESLERIRDGQKFVNTTIYEVTEKLLFLFSFSGPVAQWISRE